MEFYLKGDDILNVQNVALFSLLSSKKTGRKVLLANCHLLFNRDRGDVKLFQAALVMSGIKEISNVVAPSEPIYAFWGGDFNTLPQSPLYNFIRYSSIEDLKRYQANSWTGQAASIDIYTKWKEKTTAERIERLAYKFDAETQGEYLKAQGNETYFDSLFERLAKTSLRLEGNKLLIVPSKEAKPLVPSKLKSAYAEDFAQRLKDPESIEKARNLHGEMSFSTIPIQDPYPVCVDFVL